MSEKISFQDFIEKLGGMTGFVAASLTDEYIIDRWPMADNALDGKEAKVLEVRVFNDRKEYKLFRTDIGKEFNLREISHRFKSDALYGSHRSIFIRELENNVSPAGIYNMVLQIYASIGTIIYCFLHIGNTCYICDFSRSCNIILQFIAGEYICLLL